MFAPSIHEYWKMKKYKKATSWGGTKSGINKTALETNTAGKYTVEKTDQSDLYD